LGMTHGMRNEFHAAVTWRERIPHRSPPVGRSRFSAHVPPTGERMERASGAPPATRDISLRSPWALQEGNFDCPDRAHRNQHRNVAISTAMYLYHHKTAEKTTCSRGFVCLCTILSPSQKILIMSAKEFLYLYQLRISQWLKNTSIKGNGSTRLPIVSKQGAVAFSTLFLRLPLSSPLSYGLPNSLVGTRSRLP